ncbi:MAG: hypothetical protein ACI9F9_002936, partial [Candidatus Paceibacteria bacterium]
MSTGEYWDDEQEWDEPEPGAPQESGDWAPASGWGARSTATLALGFVAMAPLFFAYEVGLAQDPSLPR